MVFGDAMMEMCDGIHRPHNFMHVVGEKVTYRDIRAAKELMQVKIGRVTREEVLDYLEKIGAEFGDMEKLYGEYDSFAKKAVDAEKTTEPPEYFAWYNNDRQD